MNNDNNSNNMSILCPNCKNNIPSNSVTCPFCGYNLNQNNQIPQPQNINPNLTQAPQEQTQMIQEQTQVPPTNFNNNMMNNGVNTVQQPKTNKNLIFIIIGGVILVIIIVVIVLFFIRGNNNNNNTYESDNINDYWENEEKEEEENEKLSKKISSTETKTINNKLVLVLKNSNSVATDVNVEVEFYDKDGKLITSKDIYVQGFVAGSEIVKRIYDTPENYDNYKVYLDAKKTRYKLYNDKLTMSDNKNEYDIVIQLKNNSNETIDDIEVAVAFYKNNKIIEVAIANDYDIKSGRSANFELSIPHTPSFDDLDYDNYKIFVNKAITMP